MRLLFVSHSFPPRGRPQANLGGMQRVAMDLHTALGQTPGVALFDRILRSSARWTGLRSVPFLLASLWSLPHLVRRHEVDVVLFSSMVTASLAVPLRRILASIGCKTVAICHGLDVVLPSKAYQWWVRRVLSALDAVTPVSRATAAACIDRGADPARVHVIPNGIAPERFRPDEPGSISRMPGDSQNGPTAGQEETLLLLSVGRHVKRKGFDWFVDQVMPRTPEMVSYWIAGDGPATPDIREAIRRNRLEHRVHLAGQVDASELRRLYARADLFIMPNVIVPGDMEGFGVVLLEAGLMGLPCLAADLEGIRDVVTEDVNGHLLPAEDAEAFAREIRSFLTNREALARLASGTRQHVAEHFSWTAIAGRFVDLFASLGIVRHRPT